MANSTIDIFVKFGLGYTANLASVKQGNFFRCKLNSLVKDGTARKCGVAGMGISDGYYIAVPEGGEITVEFGPGGSCGRMDVAFDEEAQEALGIKWENGYVRI